MARPITDAQRAAYQGNAQSSTGPRTEALNALKPGLAAKLPFLPFEDPADCGLGLYPLALNGGSHAISPPRSGPKGE